jgi:hypothetical protein
MEPSHGGTLGLPTSRFYRDDQGFTQQDPSSLPGGRIALGRGLQWRQRLQCGLVLDCRGEDVLPSRRLAMPRQSQERQVVRLRRAAREGASRLSTCIDD